MTPDVAVIIPTFNRRAMVREAIASVLAQTHPAFELIVVDDGSTDGSVGELSRIDDTRMRIVQIANSGPAAHAIARRNRYSADDRVSSIPTICGCRRSSSASSNLCALILIARSRKLLNSGCATGAG